MTFHKSESRNDAENIIGNTVRRQSFIVEAGKIEPPMNLARTINVSPIKCHFVALIMVISFISSLYDLFVRIRRLDSFNYSSRRNANE